MAKLIGPLHSAEARGRVGGLVYNTWRGLSYAKAQCAPSQPRTKLVLQIRAWTTYLVRAWQGLSDAQRATWQEYATSHTETDGMGAPKRLTGLNWWVRNNLRSLHMGLSGFVSVPQVAAPAAPAAFNAANGVGESIVTWTATEGTKMNVGISVVGPHSAGKQGKLTRAKHNSYTAGEAGTVTITLTIPGTYTIFGRVINEDNGLASTWVSDTAVIT